MPVSLASVAHRLARTSPRLDGPSARAWSATGPSNGDSGRLIGDQLLLAAAIGAAVAIVLPTAFADARLMFGTACAALGLGLYARLWLAPRDLPAERVITGIVLLVTLVVMQLRPMGLSPLLYLWPLLLAAHISPPGRLRPDVLLAIGGFGFALVTVAAAARPVAAFLLLTAITVSVTLAYRELRMHLASLHCHLEELSSHDTMTGALNPDAFTNAFEAWVGSGMRRRVESSLLMLDVDGLTRINEEHGYDAGDEVLAYVTTIVQDELRDTDALGRIGGDEFALLLPATDAGSALQTAERLRAAVERRAGECGTPFTVSIGVTGGEAFNDPWAAAEHALALAKSAGSNLVVAAETETVAEQAQPASRALRIATAA